MLQCGAAQAANPPSKCDSRGAGRFVLAWRGGRWREARRDFRHLKVWEKAHGLALEVYACTRAFPREEGYGLVSPMRRAAVSIAANIAEGCGRAGEAELGRFLEMAGGSASELEYYLLLARDLAMLDGSSYDRLASDVTEVKRMLTSFVQRLRADGGWLPLAAAEGRDMEDPGADLARRIRERSFGR